MTNGKKNKTNGVYKISFKLPLGNK
jgi:hypothetical protein